MSPEIEYITKYFPALGVLVAVIILIAYTKKTLFQGMISQELFDRQLKREGELVGATKEAAAHLDEISRQLEGVTQKSSDEIKEQTNLIRDLLHDVVERLRTLELVFSDNIDVIRQLALQCEKHQKNSP